MKIQIENIDFEMIHVEGDSFMMGNDQSNNDWDKPEHKVNVPSFYMGKYQVTQQLWQAIMGNNPSHFQGENRPVETVSWNDSKDFITKLTKQTGKIFRLPSEAEWEYAARGGLYRQGYTYAGSDILDNVGWYFDNSIRETKAVGQKLPNELGLYDMSGNVYEWCEDVWYDNYNGAPQDGSAWVEGGNKNHRVVRGGSWYYDGNSCRVSSRGGGDSDLWLSFIGFRLALSI